MTSPPTTGSQIPGDEQLARYLLGELPAPEQAAIDDALLDDEVWEALQRAEDELLDGYVRGRLDPARRERLAERLAASPRLRERVELHRDLRTIAHARRRRVWTRARVTMAAATGALAIAAVLVFVLFGSGGRRPAERGAEVATLTLVPMTRAGTMPAVHVAGHDAIALSVVMDAEETFPRYRVRISGPGAAPWSQDAVVASGGMLALRVPVSALADGVHELEITGLGASGEAVRLGARSFRVVR